MIVHPMKKQVTPSFFHRNFFLILCLDIVLLCAAWYCAHLLRFNFEIPLETSVLLTHSLPLIVLIKLVIFYFFDLYRGMWRYTSVSDFFDVFKAAGLSSLIIVTVFLFSQRFASFSRSVFVIDWGLTVFFIVGIRGCIRLFWGSRSGEGETPWTRFFRFARLGHREEGDAKNLLIVGAGDGGEMIYREIQTNARLRYRVVGFVDDDPGKQGRKILGVPVAGGIDELRELTEKLKAHEILIAIPSVSGARMREIVSRCEASGVPFKTVPGMGELINGKVTVKAIRDVAYRDLLGREVIRLEEDRIGAYLKNARVMVTGGGGSIGSELCRQICRFHPAGIILFEQAESPLYEIDLELRSNFPYVDVVSVLGDIQDRRQLSWAFSMHRPDVVFHAAAYKHVPMMETHPWKAVKNNIFGTRNVMEAAGEHHVERFVLVSTDKAVRPVNVMGATKRVAELLNESQSACGDLKTKFMAVRFGNVVGSVGSVVPLFRKQIEKGGPVTVTHPEMTRYFMTIPEACQLILQAGAMGEGGEIFILDMGTPVRIEDMARDLIRLSGFEPDVDIRIEYVGLRPGEKLYEELITEGEGIVQTPHEKIMVLRGTPCDPGLLNGKIDKLDALAREQDADGIRSMLKEIVPEYRPMRPKG